MLGTSDSLRVLKEIALLIDFAKHFPYVNYHDLFFFFNVSVVDTQCYIMLP